jgi:cytidine deaminase
MKHTHNLEYELFDSWEELSIDDKELITQAYSICEKAYAPYSKFSVGAAVLLENGEVVLGNNQENIAYPSGLCAERVALFYTGANFPELAVQTICVVANGDLIPFDTILAPCGGCRQVMLETEIRQNKPYRVILVSQNKRTIVFKSAKDLLPFAFGTNC